ncbi:lactonase family protein [Planotetraspora sp. A-T 1434]|uniref:lactonase family protein n=1 Tax=Planotetraspora sp. A-T 1434 TaxID=2979219 RepID=UPI0021C0DE4A|nr:lactonase family protein [Planotetraspora sp. A-T 1434]MCT9930531.1 lactonase family protein [Planotetraspora sp. A-T 1434]
MRLFVGGYSWTETLATGVRVVMSDPASGELVLTGSFTGIPNPFHLLLSPTGRTLYVASNVPDGRVHVLGVGRRGSLEHRGEQSAQGAGTVHLSLHPSGRHLLAVNHDSGEVVVFPVGPDELLGPPVEVVRHAGKGPDPLNQAGPHPHMTVSDGTGAFVLVPDKGDDQVHVYRFDAGSGGLSPVGRTHLGEGVGPRHLVFHPSGRYVYVVCELQPVISVCGFDTSGALWPLGTVRTVPDEADGWIAPSGITISADGRYVYAANRGYESVAVFEVAAGGAVLKRIGEHRAGDSLTTMPWDLVLDPTGSVMYVANQMAGTLVTLSVDPESGLLDRRGAPLAVPDAACVVLAPAD